MGEQEPQTTPTPSQSARVGRCNSRKRDATQAALPERSPSLRAETGQRRSHPYLSTRPATAHRTRNMIRPSSAVSRPIVHPDVSDLENLIDMDEEMIESMTLETQEPPRPKPVKPTPRRNGIRFPDKHFFWMDDFKTIEFIRKEFLEGQFYIMNNGKIIYDFEKFVEENWGRTLVRYTFHMRLRAGKGGFGSLLRSFRVNKSTNKLMMRDLNGRRMASVDEEARLKRYLERQARKEEELKEKRKAKLAKLTAGPGKHQFEDQEYLSRREEIIEKTEDACEAGFALMKKLKKKKRLSKDEEKEESEEEGELGDEVTDLFNDRGGRKRKIDGPSIGECSHSRDEVQDDSEDDSENEPDAEELEAIRAYFEAKKKENEEEKETNPSSSEQAKEEQEKEEAKEVEPEPAKRPRLDSASNVDDLPKIDDKTPCEYGKIDLNDFQGANDLELLGLEHLKSALNDRGLKCGGSLSERAARLWMVKGKAPREYPKNILTPEMKKKLAEEEEAERKAAKKAKKAKKH